MNQIKWAAVETDIRAHIDAVIHSLNEDCPDLLDERYRLNDDYRIDSIDAYSSARYLFDQLEAGTLTHDEVYSRDELADVDRLYHLVQLNGQIHDTWRKLFGEGESALFRFIDLIGACATDGMQSWITLDSAAEAAGVKRETMRSMAYSDKHPDLRIIKGGTQATLTPTIRLSYPEFQTWLRGRRNADLQLIDNGDGTTLLDEPLIHSHSRPAGELIRALLLERHDFQWHPDSTLSNKKMHVFRNQSTGAVVAVEHNLSKPKLWIEDRRLGELPADLASIKRRHYRGGPQIAKSSEQYGRHSGLKKYDVLATADLVAVTPATMGEVDGILELLGQK